MNVFVKISFYLRDKRMKSGGSEGERERAMRPDIHREREIEQSERERDRHGRDR